MTEAMGESERTLLEQAELHVPVDSLWVFAVNNHVYRVTGHIAVAGEVEIIHVPEGHSRARYRTSVNRWLEEYADDSGAVVSRYRQIQAEPEDHE